MLQQKVIYSGPKTSPYNVLTTSKNGIIKRWCTSLKNSHQTLYFVNTKGLVLTIKYNVKTCQITRIGFQKVLNFNINQTSYSKKLIFLYETSYHGKNSIEELITKHGQGELDVFFT